LPDQVSNYDYLGEAMIKERGKKAIYLFYDENELDFDKNQKREILV